MRAPLVDLVCSSCPKPKILNEFLFDMFRPSGGSAYDTQRVMAGVDRATERMAYDPNRMDAWLKKTGMDQRSIWRRMKASKGPTVLPGQTRPLYLGGPVSRTAQKILRPSHFGKIAPLTQTADYMLAGVPGAAVSGLVRGGTDVLRSGARNFAAFLQNPLYRQNTPEWRRQSGELRRNARGLNTTVRRWGNRNTGTTP